MLCIVSSLDAGGAETFMMKLYRSLPDAYRLDFVVSAACGDHEAEVFALGGRIHRIPLRTKRPIRAFFSIRRIVRRNGYRSVLKLSDTPRALFDLLAARSGGAGKLCVRACNSASPENLLRHLAHSLLRPALNRIADVKLAPSIPAAEYMFGSAELARGKVHLLHNAVDTEFYRFSQSGRSRIRDEFGIGPAQLVIGHVGRFNHQKNHGFLLDVFAAVRQSRRDALLLLVGKGEREQEILERCRELGLEEAVIFAGVRSDVPELLSAMDVFAFPSFYEGMPNAVIEAQACGLPCIVADTITREADVTGLVSYLPLGAAAAWAGKIAGLEVKERRNSQGAKLAARGYAIGAVAREFMELCFD